MESELKFDKAMERLEKIVEDLESGNMPLEDALKKYEEGVKLSRLCTQKLTEAETKIETLTKTLNTSAEDAKSPRKKERKKTKSPVQDSDAAGDELLL